MAFDAAADGDDDIEVVVTQFSADLSITMHMADWVRKLHDFLTLNDRDILKDSGRVSHDLARALAETQFEKFESQRRAFEAQNPASDFDKQVKKLEDQWRKRKRRDCSDE